MSDSLRELILTAAMVLLAVGAVLTFWLVRKRRIAEWSAFAARHDWGFTQSWGTLEVQGLHHGNQFSLLTESRGSGKNRYTVTVLRLDLGRSVPPELSLEPEHLGDKFLKLFGAKDEELGDAELDAALDLKRVSPEARAVLRAPRVRQHLLLLHRHYQRFSIEAGLLEAEHRGLPSTVRELEAVVEPALALADALHAVARNPGEQMRG